MNKSARLLWFWVLLQACAFVAVLAWRIYLGQLPHSPIKQTKAEMRGGLKTTLELFRADCGRYPTTDEGFEALLTPPTNNPPEHWQGPYIDPSEIPRDPWRNPYVYRHPGIHNTNGYDLYSCGPDGISKSGGDDPDDINNWDIHSPHGGTFHDLSEGDAVFLRLTSVLMIIPLLYAARWIAAISSRHFREFMAQNSAADLIWRLTSIIVFVIFLMNLRPLVER